MAHVAELRYGGPTFMAWRRIKSLLCLGFTGACAFALLAPLLGIFLYLLSRGLGAIDLDFFTKMPKPVGETGGGVANAIVGSLIVIGIAALVAVPAGVLSAVYINEYGRGAKFGSAVRFSCDMLNATPSIILGIFAYSVVVLPLGHFSALAGSFALCVMMMPVVVRGVEEILRTVPDSVREASLALGASQWQTVWHVVLPAARRGIVTTVFLALARIGGETAPLLFTALGNDYWSLNLNQPINTLPVQIYKYASSPYEDWHRQAWAAALVLVLMISTANAAARYLSARKS
jgi:phosphate transport system permease protein